MKSPLPNSSKESIATQTTKKVTEYILAAFGLVAGLAWNEAIKALIEYWFPLNTNGIIAKFAYALLMTIILVGITTYLVNVLQREEKE
jgi:hypothetical protein